MNKSIGKRVVACTLAVMMVLQPMSWSYVYAGQIDVPENGLTQASDEFFVPLINGESTENAANLEVSYLEPLTLTLRDFTEEDGYVESIVFYCRSAESATSEWFEFSGGPCTLEPGQYICG